MEKNKNRSDLLAAGRKKLQQFRQKNNKGNSGRSAGKSGKPEQNKTADVGAEVAEPSVNVAEEEISTDNVASPESSSRVDSLASDSAAVTNEFSGKDDTSGTLPPEAIAQVMFEGPQADATTMTQNIGDGPHGDQSVLREDSADFGVNSSLQTDLSAQTGSARVDKKVTDVEAMQDVGGSSYSPTDKGGMTLHVADGDLSANELYEPGRDHTPTNSGNAVEEDIVPVTVLSRNDDTSPIGFATNDADKSQERHGHSVETYPSAQSGEVLPIKIEGTDHPRRDVSSGSLYEETSLFDLSGGHQHDHLKGTESTLEFTEAASSSEFSNVDNSANFIGSKHINLSSGLDGSSIKLSKLADILRFLDEDEFRFLFLSIESLPQKKKNDHVTVDNVFERVKEQLYITSFLKDAFHLQISEGQKLIDETLASNALVLEARENNEVLPEENSRFKFELEKVLSEREELQKQLHISKAEVEEFADKVDVLQNKLEMTQRDLSSLSTELVDTKTIVEALQAEDEYLNGSLKLMSEAKKMLLDENEKVLVENQKLTGELAKCKASLESLQKEMVDVTGNLSLLNDERRCLQEENDSIVSENGKVLADIAYFRSRVEALEAENKNADEIIMSMSEERKRLENEKELLVHETEQFSKELKECNDLVATLQKEVSNLNECLMSVTDERNKLEEENKSISVNCDKQSQELFGNEILGAVLEAEFRKNIHDSKEAALHIDELIYENEALKAELATLKLKIEEFPEKHLSSRSVGGVVNQDFESDVIKLQKSESDLRYVGKAKLDVYDDSSGFISLKRNLHNAEILLQNVEKATEAMHLHSMSLRGSNDAVVSSGVSRLIQAFESKSQADDHDPVQLAFPNDQTAEDPHMVAIMVLQNFGELLKELVMDAENASGLCRKEIQNKVLANSALLELRTDFDNLRKHTDEVEEASVEFMVLHEAIKGHATDGSGKESDLRVLHDALQKQENIMKSKNDELMEKLKAFEAKVTELQSRLDEICRGSDEMFASITNQLRTLETEVAERESSLEDNWKSDVARVLQIAAELDNTVQMVYADYEGGISSKHDFVGRVSNSVSSATKLIRDLQGQLQAACKDHREASDAYNVLYDECGDLKTKYETAISVLARLYNEITEIADQIPGYMEETKNVEVGEKVLDLLNPDFFSPIFEQLRNLLRERLQLESANDQLTSELMNRATKIAELEIDCLMPDTIVKLARLIQQSLRLDGLEIHADSCASQLESLIHLLVQKYDESQQDLSLSTSLKRQLGQLEEEMEHFSSVFIQIENENLVLKHSLQSALDDLAAFGSKVQGKAAELDQSEQRVSTLREKLSIAVTKGKGLISQRDSLKQSLTEVSKELEKCSQDLLFKDSRLHELEEKLKVYSEAGERMEALESELSYIRNSATALREEFLLKDSVLQRIEEILEDLELPEHFHSRDMIEKVDWLAKSVIGNSGPLENWNQKSSLGGGSYSDSGFMGPDGSRDDMQPNANSDDELRRRFEDLENKFYQLAEQNEMLEQSLLERNNLVQRLEESLGRLDMPSQLRSMEPEDKIQWLESALSGAKNLCDSLQHKVDSLGTSCATLNDNVEVSHRKISELEVALQHACEEKDILTRKMEVLSRDEDETSRKLVDLSVTAEYLRSEIFFLQEHKIQLEEVIHHTDYVVGQLQEFVRDTLRDSGIEVLDGREGLGCFEEMLRALVEKYKVLLAEKPIGIDDTHIAERDPFSHISSIFGEQDLSALSKKLDDSAGEIKFLKEEKDQLMISKQFLLHDVETLGVKMNELQELLNQEEQKSTSLREKLNLAVRKGKSLVQQRDGMKQVIEELNAEVARLKSETSNMEKVVSEYEEQFKAFVVVQEKMQSMEHENGHLRDRLEETEIHLQEKEGSWRNILNALDDIDVGLSSESAKPVEKLKKIGNLLHDMRTGMDSAQQESIKSRRAANLLLEELNEVQERNDGLQEELAKAVQELSVLSREKDLAEKVKNEALANVEKLSYVHTEEKGRLSSEVTALQSDKEQMKEKLTTIEREVGDVLSNDLEVLQNVEMVMKSYLDLGAAADLNDPFLGGYQPGTSKNEVSNSEISPLRDVLDNHSDLFRTKASGLSEVVRSIFKQYNSNIESYESMKHDREKLESLEKQKEKELHILRENVSLICRTCTSIISEIKNFKDHEYGNFLTSRTHQRSLESEISIEEDSFTRGQTFTEEEIRGISDKLVYAVKDLLRMHSELVEVGDREMKITLLNLQKELQEKDIQRDKISVEFVNQVKEAENNAKRYMQDLQQTRTQLQELQKQVNVRDEDCKVLEQKIKELQYHETNSLDLQQKVSMLVDELAEKKQENEALMQALEEEEVQMEDLANKSRVLENELQQKNRDLENLEASRAKALKKLSVTLGKFDELHHFSESLLTEVEKLQSQLQERDGEVSFLRQEVTRCTNDALAVTQMTKNRSSVEIHDFLSWLDSLLSPVKALDAEADKGSDHVNVYKERLQKQIADIITELENLRLVAQNSDMLLQQEKHKVEELALKEEHLKKSLHDKEYQLVMLQGSVDSGKPTTSSSEIVEVEPATNIWASAGTNIASQVRSLRKTNNDQVAIAIDTDHSGDRLEEDDDKAHGFKSLTSSKIVPRFTRPVSDIVDGLWMSCDRALMRQPTLRLGVIIYWAVLHALLANFVV